MLKGSPAKREFSVRYCMAMLSFITLDPVAPATASVLRLDACTHTVTRMGMAICRSIPCLCLCKLESKVLP